jgi:hypothetical protein
MKEIPDYEERLITYLDILGWSRLLEASAKNKQLLRSIDSVAEWIAEVSRFTGEVNKVFVKLSSKIPKLPEDMFSLPLGLQATHFSDTIVLSSPVRQESSMALVGMTAGLANVVLKGGYYVRGALTRGLLRHTQKTLYGPAIVKAYHIEQNIAIYPRIVVTSDVETLLSWGRVRVDECDSVTYLDVLSHANFEDLGAIRKVFEHQMKVDSGNLVRMQKHQWFRHYLDETWTQMAPKEEGQEVTH